MDPVKILRTSLAVFALDLAVTGATAAQDSISIVFANPEKYTDLRTKALLLDWLQKELRESTGS
jgi:hypothetical protein